MPIELHVKEIPVGLTDVALDLLNVELRYFVSEVLQEAWGEARRAF
jgi:hypothetical protein